MTRRLDKGTDEKKAECCVNCPMKNNYVPISGNCFDMKKHTGLGGVQLKENYFRVYMIGNLKQLYVATKRCSSADGPSLDSQGTLVGVWCHYDDTS